MPGGRFVQGDGQHHRALGFHTQQQLVGVPRQHGQRQGVRATAQWALGVGLQAAQRGLLCDVAVCSQVHLDALQHWVVDIQHPQAVGCHRHGDRDAQPHRFRPHAQGAAVAGWGLKAGQFRKDIIHEQGAGGVWQHGDCRPGLDGEQVIPQFEGRSPGTGRKGSQQQAQGHQQPGRTPQACQNRAVTKATEARVSHELSASSPGLRRMQCLPFSLPAYMAASASRARCCASSLSSGASA